MVFKIPPHCISSMSPPMCIRLHVRNDDSMCISVCISVCMCMCMCVCVCPHPACSPRVRASVHACVCVRTCVRMRPCVGRVMTMDHDCRGNG